MHCSSPHQSMTELFAGHRLFSLESLVKVGLSVGGVCLVILSDVLGVEVFFLAPTVSGDGAGVCFCVLLPPSSPRFDGIPSKP